MDSTPTPSTHQPPLISIKSSPRKLPIKRKTPDSSFFPLNNSPPIQTPKLESSTTTEHRGDEDHLRRLPPFKFHRIWIEPDEIRFLQGLLDCTFESLSFPRDLNVFFNRFSNTMSQPYTKSQLSEKIRRLRKKFRVISARLAKGLDKSLLSPHDRALYELSEKLWHPDYSSTSPFGRTGGGSNSKIPVKISNLVGVKVSFSPSIPLSNKTESNDDSVNNNIADYNYDGGGGGGYEDVKLSEVNVEFEEDCVLDEEELPRMGNDRVNQIGETVAKTVVDVFDQSLKDAKMGMKFTQGGEGKDGSFKKRWRELRFAEMEVLAQRLRLVVEDSLQRQRV